MSEDEKNSSFAEKGGIQDYVVPGDAKYKLDVAERDHVQRRLKERHVQMIAVSLFFAFSATIDIHRRE